jgi:hypothetical protein
MREPDLKTDAPKRSYLASLTLNSIVLFYINTLPGCRLEHRGKVYSNQQFTKPIPETKTPSHYESS